MIETKCHLDLQKTRKGKPELLHNPLEVIPICRRVGVVILMIFTPLIHTRTLRLWRKVETFINQARSCLA